MWENVIVIALVAIVAFFAARSVWKLTRVTEGSGSGCGCSSAGSCGLAKKCPTKDTPPAPAPGKTGA